MFASSRRVEPYTYNMTLKGQSQNLTSGQVKVGQGRVVTGNPSRSYMIIDQSIRLGEKSTMTPIPRLSPLDRKI